MTSFQPSRFLRRVLALDAISCAALGAALVGFAPLFGELFSISTTVLRGAGLVLLPCAAYLAFLASRATLPRVAVWVAILANGLWLAESLITLISGAIDPSAVGYAFVLAQAGIVAVFIELEVLGMKRSRSALAAA